MNKPLFAVRLIATATAARSFGSLGPFGPLGSIGVLAALALGAVAGCTATNPDYCDRPGCQLLDGDDLSDLGPGPGDDLSVLDMAPPPRDAREPDGRADLAMTCSGDEDCPSSICQPDGTCADESDVVYVDNHDGRCTGTHTGTQLDPVCTLDKGVALCRASDKKKIHVAGSTVAYTNLRIEGLVVSVFGPGAFANPSAQVFGPTRVSGDAKVLLDGLNLSGASSSDDVVFCQSSTGPTPTLTISRSRVHGGPNHGAHAMRCDLTLLRSSVYSNGKAGVLGEQGGSLLLVNSYLLYNREVGLRLLDGSLRMRFCDVLENGGAALAPSAIDCGSGIMIGSGRTVEDSIVVQNVRAIGGSQVSQSCRLLSTAIDEGSANGSGNKLNAHPNFDANIHLQRGFGSDACCINQIDTSDVLIDYDGNTRPQGAAWDIGANEVL